MAPLALLALLCAPALGQKKKTAPSPIFVAPNTGLEFTVPSDWSEVTTKRETAFTFPLKNAGGTAVLHVFSISFRAEASRWNDAQKDIAKQLHQDVLEQRQEELLGVPLLLSKTRGPKGTVLTGLVYTQAQTKLLFRLESSDSAADEAESTWRQAFLSLRTVTGAVARPDDPNKELPSKTIASPAPKAPAVTVIGAVKPPPTVKGEVTLTAIVAARQVTIRLPKGWTTRPIDGTAWGLVGPSSAPSGLKLEAFSTLDSPPAIETLLRRSATSLDLFSKVAARDEKDGKRSQSGCLLSTVWRTGTAQAGGAQGGGALETVEAVTAQGDFYLVVTGQFAGGLKKDQREAIAALLQVLSIEGKV